MRTRYKLLLGLAALAALAASLTLVQCAVAKLIVDDDWERDDALREYWQGHHHFDAGRFLEAIPHYDVYRQLLRRRGQDDSEVAGSIASCLWRGGKETEAMAAFAESIAANPRWYVCVEKAHCLAKRDREAALAWLHDAPLPSERREQALADFHRQRREFAEAIPFFEARLRRSCGGASVFDEDDRLLIVDLPLTSEKGSGLGGLLDPLTNLAECHFGLGDLDRAASYARRGIAVGQLLDADETYRTPTERDVGSERCRLWLARIAMARSSWDEAATHIEYARQGNSYFEKQVQAAAAELEARRTAK